MYKKLSVFLGLFAALAINLSAQSIDFQNQSAINVGASVNVPDPITRPRIVDGKAAGVESSVIVNTRRSERIAFELINQKRAENGLEPLTWSDDLASIARIHSQNMAQLNFFSHRGQDNKMVSDRADAAGIKKWRAIGENIAFNRGYGDPISKAVDLWLNSPSHRHNLLDENWKETAVGVAIGADGSFYFTQVFLKK